MRVSCPFCEEHGSRMRSLSRSAGIAGMLLIGILFGGVVGFIGGIMLISPSNALTVGGVSDFFASLIRPASHEAHEQARADLPLVVGLSFIGAFIGFAVWGIAAKLLIAPGIRATNITDDEITLQGVSGRFVKAAEAQSTFWRKEGSNIIAP